MAAERRDLVAALEAAVHRVLDLLASELADLELTHGEINALAALASEGAAVTVASLQRATGQRASTLTGVLDRLERRGLAERALNPADRRSFVVTLTDTGSAAGARVRQLFAALEREVANGIRPDALNGFFAVIDRLEELTE